MSPVKRCAILGASRGLGRALVANILRDVPDAKLFLSSRRVESLRDRARDGDTVEAADFTASADQNRVLAALSAFGPTDVFYVAGGGPYGKFADKPMHSHQWALELNLAFPMRLLHDLLQGQKAQNIVLVGSAIAENKPDPMAASYCAAKHGLVGLVSTVALEYPDSRIRLFSPGYMDTDMLPPNAAVRGSGVPIEHPAMVAAKLWQFSQN